VGYYGVFLGLQYKNNFAMARQLDAADADCNLTFEIKIPLTVAYAVDDQEFKRVSGQFAYQGEFYQMVKQKLAHDTLTVICLKDQQQKKIQGALADFVKTFTGTPATSSSGKLLPSLIKDYLLRTLELRNLSTGWENSIYETNNCKIFIPSYSSTILHPPERG
jgi:hypothetical protein